MEFKEILDIVSKCSVIVAVAAYLLQRRAMHAQHERARREKATSVVLEFAKSLTPRSAAARKLARHFNDHQIESLEQGREFTVSTDDRDLLLAALSEHVKPEDIPATEDIKLTRNQSYLLRWEIISRLNSCEL